MKPQPKQEIIVERVKDMSLLFIDTASEDARVWIAQEAPQFGIYHAPTEAEPYCSLHVSALYDVDEVKRYLETQGQEAGE